MDGVVRCIEAGAEDYLFKPVNPTLLRARIGSALDKLRAEEAVSRKQRLESIGVLAAGIAHDFNNLLTGIIGHAQLLQSVLAAPHDREMADSIVEAGERAAELTRQLLAYAGKGIFQMQEIDLSALVHDTEALIRTSLPRKVRLELNLGKVPSFTGDANQIRQALLNLTLNAGESIGSDKPGVVTIRTALEKIEAHSRFDVAPDRVEPGDYVRLEVRDTGCGMDTAMIGRIFEPFFTTKFLGRGLGLAATAGIVRSHRGMLTVESAPGEGSSFRLFLPVSKAAAPSEPEGRASVVLVVDDEPVVRQIVKLALERAGHHVVVADSGQAALDAFAQMRGKIDLVLLDWKMPGMDGAETLRKLKARAPDVKIIISSGVAQSDAEQHLGVGDACGYLQKPYRMSELTTLVESSLNR
jgi:signal transduction histidine kinase